MNPVVEFILNDKWFPTLYHDLTHGGLDPSIVEWVPLTVVPSQIHCLAKRVPQLYPVQLFSLLEGVVVLKGYNSIYF